MGKVCQYANKVDEDLYLCTKHRSYCYLDEPNEITCKDLYGDEYTVGKILDDEDNIEDSIQ